MPPRSDFDTFKKAFISNPPSRSNTASTVAGSRSSAESTISSLPTSTDSVSNLSFGTLPSSKPQTKSKLKSTTGSIMASTPAADKGVKPATNPPQSSGNIKPSKSTSTVTVTTPTSAKGDQGKHKQKYWKYENFPFSTVWKKGDSLTFSNPPLFVCPIGETIQNIYGFKLPPPGVKLDDNSAWQVFNAKLTKKDMAAKWPHDFVVKGQFRLNRPHRGFGAMASDGKGWQFIDKRSIGAQTYPRHLLCGDPVFMNGWSPFEEKRRQREAPEYNPAEKPPQPNKSRIHFDAALLTTNTSDASDSEDEKDAKKQKNKRSASEETEAGVKKKQRLGSEDEDSDTDMDECDDVEPEDGPAASRTKNPASDLQTSGKPQDAQKTVASIFNGPMPNLQAPVNPQVDEAAGKPVKKTSGTSPGNPTKIRVTSPEDQFKEQATVPAGKPIASKLIDAVQDHGPSLAKPATIIKSIEKETGESKEKAAKPAVLPRTPAAAAAATATLAEEDDESEDDLLTSFTRLEYTRRGLCRGYQTFTQQMGEFAQQMGEFARQMGQFTQQMDARLDRQFLQHQKLRKRLTRTKKVADKCCTSCRERLLPAFDASFDPTDVDDDDEQGQEQEQGPGEERQEDEETMVSAC